MGGQAFMFSWRPYVLHLLLSVHSSVFCEEWGIYPWKRPPLQYWQVQHSCHNPFTPPLSCQNERLWSCVCEVVCLFVKMQSLSNACVVMKCLFVCVWKMGCECRCVLGLCVCVCMYLMYDVPCPWGPCEGYETQHQIRISSAVLTWT